VSAETVSFELSHHTRRAASRHRTAEDIPGAFGRVLRDQRIARGLSQEALAYAAGMDRTYMGRLECGYSLPTLFKMCKLAAALDMPLSKLIACAEEAALQAEMRRRALETVEDSGTQIQASSGKIGDKK
jgi:transcriptional regulator with XRE-family HTH domain